NRRAENGETIGVREPHLSLLQLAAKRRAVGCRPDRRQLVAAGLFRGPLQRNERLLDRHDELAIPRALAGDVLARRRLLWKAARCSLRRSHRSRSGSIAARSG